VGEFGARDIASIRVIESVKDVREDMAAEPMELLLAEDDAAAWNWPALAEQAQFHQAQSGRKLWAREEAEQQEQLQS
jgi:hypothetical protein